MMIPHQTSATVVRAADLEVGDPIEALGVPATVIGWPSARTMLNGGTIIDIPVRTDRFKVAATVVARPDEAFTVVR